MTYSITYKVKVLVIDSSLADQPPSERLLFETTEQREEEAATVGHFLREKFENEPHPYNDKLSFRVDVIEVRTPCSIPTEIVVKECDKHSEILHNGVCSICRDIAAYN